MNVLSKFALILGFGSIMFTLFIVFNTPGALEQAERLDFPLTASLNDAAQITLMLPVFLAIGATVVALTQLKDEYGGRVFVLVAFSWLALIGVLGVDGLTSFLSR